VHDGHDTHDRHGLGLLWSPRIFKFFAMRDNEGFDILHNGVPRTFKDDRETAFEAARYAKSKARGEIIGIVDRSTGTKLLMQEDGRTG
jgi:hypothetical protein